MAKFICIVCGTIYEGFEAPEKCPICKAPSSKFSLLDERSKSDNLQKINEEDYEIVKKIEENGYLKAVEWYKENYDCDLSEAKEIVKTVKEKYNVESNDDDEILSMFGSLRNQSAVVKWYMETYEVDRIVATTNVNKVLNRTNMTTTGGSSGNGCIITILIAITSTLSVLCLL